MKSKIVVIIFLAVLLIGVAYIKALFSHQDREGVLTSEVAGKVPPEIMDDYLKKDEAVRTQDSLKLLYADSLNKITAKWSNMVDSLPQANIDSLQSLIEQLKKKADEAEENAEKAKRGKTEQFEKLIGAFYKGEIAQLPADLTQYEREVSTKEIKSKAIKYFGISSESLKRIIKKYK